MTPSWPGVSTPWRRHCDIGAKSGAREPGVFHHDVIKWKYFSRYWPLVRGIHRSTVNSPHKGQWRGTLMFSLICAWINNWVNNREAGDLRRHRAHYGVTVMLCCCLESSALGDNCTWIRSHPCRKSCWYNLRPTMIILQVITHDVLLFALWKYCITK